MRRVVAAALVVLSLACGCGRSGAPVAAGQGSGARFFVVAAESFWGSLAAQLAGNRADVASIIVNPNTDPHSYEPDAQDARTIAGGQVVIVNGLGYDEWAGRLLGASPLSGRVVLNVGKVLALRPGDNPHQWYSPAHVRTVIDAITAAYQKLDPSDAAYFSQQRSRLIGSGLARYDALRTEIRSQFAGVAAGYSESIFQPLSADLGLKLLTPYSFAKAIAEGTDVTASDKQAVDEQASRRLIRVWVFNSQNVTPDVQRINAIARRQHIPVATVTESLTPPGASFQQWQVSQLEGLLAALRASGANDRPRI